MAVDPATWPRSQLEKWLGGPAQLDAWRARRRHEERAGLERAVAHDQAIMPSPAAARAAVERMLGDLLTDRIMDVVITALSEMGLCKSSASE